MLLGTVGVSPGTYSVRFDELRPIGINTRTGPDSPGWYMTTDEMLADYMRMYMGIPSIAGGPMTAMPPPGSPMTAMPPPATSTGVPVGGMMYSPYGTDMALNGLREAPPPTKFGLRLDILGIVLGGIVATGLIISAIADR